MYQQQLLSPSNEEISANFGDYLVFIDESGDHNLGQTIDRQFPVFVLMFLVVKKQDYVEKVVPAFQWLKLSIWGHDQIILHEREIRRFEKAFHCLKTNQALADIFFKQLNQLMQNLNYKLLPVLIDKLHLSNRNLTREEKKPYTIALQQGLDQLCHFLIYENQTNKQVTLIFESREKKRILS